MKKEGLQSKQPTRCLVIKAGHMEVDQERRQSTHAWKAKMKITVRTDEIALRKPCTQARTGGPLDNEITRHVGLHIVTSQVTGPHRRSLRRAATHMRPAKTLLNRAASYPHTGPHRRSISWAFACVAYARRGHASKPEECREAEQEGNMSDRTYEALQD